MHRLLRLPGIALIVLLAVAGRGLAGAVPVPAGGMLAFDFEAVGPLNVGDYWFVGPGAAYTEAQGFGWVGDRGHPYDRPRGAAGSNYPATGEVPLYELVRDGITFTDTSFRVDLASSEYTVTVLLGDLAASEPRGNNAIDANGVRVVNGLGTAGDVKACTFGVTVMRGHLLLRFYAEAPWRQIGVCAVLVQAGPGPTAVTVRDALTATDLRVALPDKWDAFTRRVDAMLDRCLAENAHGRADFHAVWEQSRSPDALRAPGVRRVMLWENGLLCADNQARLLPLVRRLGMDGLCVGSRPQQAGIGAWLAPQGLIHTVIFGAEGYPGGKVPDGQLNGLRSQDGTASTIPNVYSNLNPDVHEAFRVRLGTSMDVVTGAAGVILDEPRGCWSSGGRIGDFSPAAEAALRTWAAANGYPGLAANGFPAIGWSRDAYGFHLFRLESVPRFVNALRTLPAFKDKPVYPGNGRFLTGTNPHCLRPDVVARHGLQGVQWLYIDPPFRVKYCVEMMVAAGYQTDYWCAALGGWQGYLNTNPPPLASLRLVSGLSALPDRVTVWGMDEVLNDAERSALFLDLSRVVRATSGFAHETAAYVYLPVSLTYPDLVNWTTDEGTQAEAVIAALYDGNLDFKVSYDLGMPTPAMAVYTARQPVLTDAEWGRVAAFLQRGGLLVYVAPQAPLDVEGKPLAAAAPVFARLPTTGEAMVRVGDGTLHWVRSGFSAAAVRTLAEGGRVRLNPSLPNPALRSFAYAAGAESYVLLANADTAAAQSVVLPFAGRDVLRGAAHQAGDTVRLPPGGCLLLRH